MPHSRSKGKNRNPTELLLILEKSQDQHLDNFMKSGMRVIFLCLLSILDFLLSYFLNTWAKKVAFPSIIKLRENGIKMDSSRMERKKKWTELLKLTES